MLDPRDSAMDADKLQQIQAHARAIAALLSDETARLAIDKVRRHRSSDPRADLGACQPRNWSFFIATASGTSSGRSRQLKSILGEISISENQAQLLQVKARTQLSHYLEKCCLLVSANASYERSAQDVAVLTGTAVSRGTQQRLVHRQTFALPVGEKSIEEMSIDGGQVRIRTPS